MDNVCNRRLFSFPSIVRPMKCDKIRHVSSLKKKTIENGLPKCHTITVKFSIFIIVLMARARICPGRPKYPV